MFVPIRTHKLVTGAIKAYIVQAAQRKHDVLPFIIIREYVVLEQTTYMCVCACQTRMLVNFCIPTTWKW
jgi:hypothetical protein